MTTDQMYREFQSRRHKLLGAYLVFWAWTNKVSCVVLTRERLLPYLGLEGRMEKVRIEWLKEDLEQLFPHMNPLYDADNGRFETLYLSRLKFPNGCFDEPMANYRRVEFLKEHRIKADIAYIPTESKIIKLLSELSHGISDFAEFQADTKVKGLYT